ncbi:hypothetical protein R1flu_004555 [Riccia fluitans]|uniref:Uncharacterized protein n=1 Tax=Riccia fluitans TaxID=41844 RepID=A0ABD1YQM1_9MARC
MSALTVWLPVIGGVRSGKKDALGVSQTSDMPNHDNRISNVGGYCATPPVLPLSPSTWPCQTLVARTASPHRSEVPREIVPQQQHSG